MYCFCFLIEILEGCSKFEDICCDTLVFQGYICEEKREEIDYFLFIGEINIF